MNTDIYIYITPRFVFVNRAAVVDLHLASAGRGICIIILLQRLARLAVLDLHLVSAGSGICTIILLQRQPADKMGRFNALLFLVFAFGLMSSVSLAKDPSGANRRSAQVVAIESHPQPLWRRLLHWHRLPSPQRPSCRRLKLPQQRHRPPPLVKSP
jgi:hypothetical protein